MPFRWTSAPQKSIVAVLIPAAALVAGGIARAQSGGDAGEDSPQAAAGFTENFDSGSLQGWHFSCQHSLIPTQSGRALQTSGGGHAIWTAAGSVEDFVLQFRYGYQKGVGDVVFRMTESAQGMECYCLMLQPDGISLVRRLHAAGGKCPEQRLAAVQGTLQPQQWYEFTVQAVGGQIDVAIGDQKVLSHRDPSPLTRGPCGLGVIADSGAVLYDDARLVAVAPAGSSSPVTPEQTNPSWP